MKKTAVSRSGADTPEGSSQRRFHSPVFSVAHAEGEWYNMILTVYECRPVVLVGGNGERQRVRANDHPPTDEDTSMIPSMFRCDDWRHAVAHFRAVAATIVFCGLACAILAAAPPASAGPPSIVTPVPLRDLDTLIAQTDRGVLVGMASWCGPCKAELPHLVKLHKHYHGQGLALYGVSVDFAGAQAMQPMVNRFGVEFPVYWVGEAGVEHYGLNPIPMLVFIQNGRVVDRLQGAHGEEELRTIFDNFLTPREP